MIYTSSKFTFSTRLNIHSFSILSVLSSNFVYFKCDEAAKKSIYIKRSFEHGCSLSVFK